MHYFDYASTSNTDSDVLNKYIELLKEYFANSESKHPLGISVNKLLEDSRRQTAALLHIKPSEVIFTSGASEANSLAIKGYAFANSNRGKHLITTKIEHSSVINSFKQLEKVFGYEVTYLDVDYQGRISVSQLAEALRKDTILVSIMDVNNETGTIQPIDDVKKLLVNYPTVKLHVDCVQALGKLPIDLKDIDMASFGAHKINGLKGSGVLYKKESIKLIPLISGGEQEKGLRGGTENALNYAMFGLTLKKALDNQDSHLQQVKELNNYLRVNLEKIPDIVFNSPQDASPYILNISCLKLPSEVHLNALGNEGFCVSAHSTCNSKSKDTSSVLSAMGITGRRLEGIIRISICNQTTKEEIDLLCKAIKENLINYGIR